MFCLLPAPNLQIENHDGEALASGKGKLEPIKNAQDKSGSVRIAYLFAYFQLAVITGTRAA